MLDGPRLHSFRVHTALGRQQSDAPCAMTSSPLQGDPWRCPQSPSAQFLLSFLGKKGAREDLSGSLFSCRTTSARQLLLRWA